MNFIGQKLPHKLTVSVWKVKLRAKLLAGAAGWSLIDRNQVYFHGILNFGGRVAVKTIVMEPGVRIAVGVDLCLFFSTALLVDYQANPPTPTQAHINGFLNALAQPGGPVEAAYSYLRGGGFFPVYLNVVWLTL